LLNSRLTLVTATSSGSGSKSLHLGGTPSSEVTGLFCRVPFRSLVRAPEDTLLAYLCRFTVRSHRDKLRGCFLAAGIGELVGPRAFQPIPLTVRRRICLPPGYRSRSGIPSPDTRSLPRHPIALTKWCWNINQLPISYAVRPRLRDRLTPG
jgi:hypothetical protein